MDSSSIRRLSRSWGTPLLVAVMLTAACGGGGNTGGPNTASPPGLTAATITVRPHPPPHSPAAPR